MRNIIALFDPEKCLIPTSDLVSKNLMRPTPDKIFREVKKDRVPVLIPASNAIGIVLRYNLTKEPSLDELENIARDTTEL
jgi:hypothetical protein